MIAEEKILMFLIQKYHKRDFPALALGKQRAEFLKKIENQQQIEIYKNVLNETEKEGLDQNRIYHFPCNDIDRIEKRFPLVFAQQMIESMQCFQLFLNHLDLILSFDGVFILVDQFDWIAEDIPVNLGLEFIESLSAISKYKILTSGIQDQYFYLVTKKNNFHIAVAIEEDNYIFQGMFGKTSHFGIYECSDNKLRKIGSRLNIFPPEVRNQRIHKIYDLVNDCSVLIGSAFCENAKKILNEKGIHFIEEKNPLNLDGFIFQEGQLYRRK